MRYTAEHKEETHRKIVRTASHEFRRHGLFGVGIADLMKKAGLTHGGFYAHFTDRDTLVEEATAAGYEEAAARLLSDLAQVPSDKAVRTLVDRYLSAAHRVNVEHGCPLPALAGDMSRQTPRVRRAFTTRFKRYSGRLAALLPHRGRHQKERQDTALALLSGMAGAILLARAVSDPELSDRILTAARRFYLDALEHQHQHQHQQHQHQHTGN